MKLFLKCNDAANVCDKYQYKEASLFDKIKLSLHLLLCKLCRKYAKNNIKLTNSINSVNIKTLTPESKQVLKEKLQQELSNGLKS